MHGQQNVKFQATVLSHCMRLRASNNFDCWFQTFAVFWMLRTFFLGSVLSSSQSGSFAASPAVFHSSTLKMEREMFSDTLWPTYFFTFQKTVAFVVSFTSSFPEIFAVYSLDTSNTDPTCSRSRLQNSQNLPEIRWAAARQIDFDVVLLFRATHPFPPPPQSPPPPGLSRSILIISPQNMLRLLPTSCPFHNSLHEGD